jgi:PIN domain nuclease of toxin-antitoxin system
MRILLDTQCWLWMAAFPERLSSRARELVETTEHELFLSSASAWEIAIKCANGKLRLPQAPERYVVSRMSRLRTHPLPIEHAHALRVSALPPHHRDPFDRLLVAQAQLGQLPILTADPILSRYDVETIAG